MGMQGGGTRVARTHITGMTKRKNFYMPPAFAQTFVCAHTEYATQGCSFLFILSVPPVGSGSGSGHGPPVTV